MPDSIKTTRIALIVAAGLEFATAALFVFIFLSGAILAGWGSEARGLLGNALLGPAGLLLAAVFVLLGVAALFIASGIAKGRLWARFAGVAMGVVLLAGVPVGTVLGIIALLGLLGRDARDWFGGRPAPRATVPVRPAGV